MKKILFIMVVALVGCNKSIPSVSMKEQTEKANEELRIARFLEKSYRNEGKADSAAYYHERAEGMRTVMFQLHIPEE